MMRHHSGFVSIIGRPNVGKSTLVNRMVGQKISIVTSKPNTTRHAILGVLTKENYQVIFIDTPGLINQRRRLMDKVMHRAASGSLEGASLVLLVIEANKWLSKDSNALEIIKHANVPCILVVNKVDKIKPKSKLLVFLESVAKKHNYLEILPISALKNENLDRLENEIVKNLPEEIPLFPSEMLTDKGIQFRIAESIREKLMQNLHQELPYGVGVEIDHIEDLDERLNVSAIIWVERESHKGIVIGSGGQSIKDIGQKSRFDMQDILNRKVHLVTRVKVKRNWTGNSQWIDQFGYGVSE
ncbi:MAG: GTPase Era [Pseudomonadota bacterium]|nr:GTPase Era [Pseudomonadota bacterium]